jgi:hypothetical protein
MFIRESFHAVLAALVDKRPSSPTNQIRAARNDLSFHEMLDTLTKKIRRNSYTLFRCRKVLAPPPVATTKPATIVWIVVGR